MRDDEEKDPITQFAIQYNFTPRETELFHYITMHGYSDKQIASSLKISKKTVSFHMGSLFLKAGCTSSRELLSMTINKLLKNTGEE